MSLDPEGPWLERGARALDNPPGEESSLESFSRYWTHSGGRTPVGGSRGS
ncbi:unnamed protein product [Prunus armeniaca]|uniref:Uncharacterized protein n=1 Tax=Prunus armeniaca TaxID=36596 RepID=A0A6J5XDN3_PRUAR|nr:unnamed protein product [Prunus armeniaca]